MNDLMTALTGLLFWICVLGVILRRWKKNHPGESVISAGGLTNYDQTMADETGRAVARELHRLNNTKQQE